jgi:hypothetical protein
MTVIKNDVYHVSKHGGWTILFVLIQEISLVICSIGKSVPGDRRVITPSESTRKKLTRRLMGLITM